MKAKRLSFFSALFVFSFSLLSCGPSISSSQSELSSSSTSIADSTSSQNSSESGISSSPSSSGSSISYSEPKYDDISFHFLELGNAKTGDSIFIKAGNTDILIDAGSYYNSYSSISTAINQYCTDGILEYVIATHAHLDHIAGFTHNYAKEKDKSGDGVFYNYKIGTIIDFPKTTSETNVYDYYLYARDYAVSQGAAHFTALDCTKNANGASKSYSLGKGLSMEIMYQKYYESSTADENNNSVVVMFSQGPDNHFLFAGDLEQDGEKSLVDSNPTLPKMKLFKADHHASYTANSTYLLSKIQPEVVCVTCCAGNQQYTSGADHVFPTQEFVNDVAQYTKNIYVTTLGSFTDTSKSSPFNGQINVVSRDGSISVNCSNNNTILPLSTWFNTVGDLYPNKPNRTWPANGVKLT